MNKYGIFGGLFDPPHLGHLIIAQGVLEEFGLKKIIFVPAYNPPHKYRYSSFHIRYKMVELAIEGNTNFLLSRIEEQMSGKTFTIEVVKRLKQEIRRQLYLIIGADQWLEIKTWRSPEKLIRECQIVVVPRPGYELNKGILRRKKVLTSHTPLIDISSTRIRKMVKQGANIRYLVPGSVLRYIWRQRLYQ